MKTTEISTNLTEQLNDLDGVGTMVYETVRKWSEAGFNVTKESIAHFTALNSSTVKRSLDILCDYKLVEKYSTSGEEGTYKISNKLKVPGVSSYSSSWLGASKPIKDTHQGNLMRTMNSLGLEFTSAK